MEASARPSLRRSSGPWRGEYSRELSAKVFTGQCRLIRYGFRQGGPAGFGLRRVLVDENRNQKAELSRGEHKSLQTDRVILRPGPAEEVETVQRIYRLFTLQGLREREIAGQLNSEGIVTDLDRPWTRGTVPSSFDQRKVHRQQRLQPRVLQIEIGSRDQCA